MKKLLTTLYLLTLTVSTSLALAEQPPSKGGHHPPPPEAIDACEGLAKGDPCNFEGRNGEDVEGSCFTPSQDKPLACRPDHPPPGEGGGQGGKGGQKQKPCDDEGVEHTSP